MTTNTNVAGSADYVIVGAGSAGAVMANRLSEDPKTSVILIEAGGEAKAFVVQLPAGLVHLLRKPAFDWCYEQEPDPSVNGRGGIWSAGRLLGGSSSINGQVYIRGTRHDFDEWAEMGATGWSFNEVFPYFLRSECWQGEPSQAHGASGPLSISPTLDPHPLCRAFLKGCGEVGLPTLAEYNDGAAFGAFLTQTNQRDGWRCSTEKGYLRPIRKRPNLRIITQAEVETVRVVDGRAVGVTLLREGRRETVDALGEVIVCAGAMGSPALLMRSGIGPAPYLRSRDIEVVCESAGVGENLQEHSAAGVSRYVNVPTLNSQMGPWDMVSHLARFFWNRTGPLSAPAVQAMGLAKTRADLPEPDIQLHFMPLAFDGDPDMVSPGSTAMPKDPAVTINTSLCKPRGRGRVELGERGQARVVHRLLDNPHDRATLVAGMDLVNRIFEAPTLKKLTVANRAPQVIPTTDEGWIEYLRANTTITWHAVGTCRMGSDAEAVVDPKLRFRGVGGLRIVDASVMPTTTSSNTNAPTIMIAEKAAEMIRLGE